MNQLKLIYNPFVLPKEEMLELMQKSITGETSESEKAIVRKSFGKKGLKKIKFNIFDNPNTWLYLFN